MHNANGYRRLPYQSVQLEEIMRKTKVVMTYPITYDHAPNNRTQALGGHVSVRYAHPIRMPILTAMPVISGSRCGYIP